MKNLWQEEATWDVQYLVTDDIVHAPLIKPISLASGLRKRIAQETVAMNVRSDLGAN